jgi:hypothetical protein
MSILLTPEEMSMFRNAPEDELVDLAVDLDIPVPEEIDLVGLLDAVVRSLAALGQREGLPYSPYDEGDLEALAPAELGAIAKLNGIPADTEPKMQVTALLKTGKKIYKQYRKTRPKSQIPMYLPMLLAPLARHLVGQSD